MTLCPKCKKENQKSAEKWKYGQFTVQAYLCGTCGTQFNEYFRNGGYNFAETRKRERLRKSLTTGFEFRAE